MKNYGRIKKMRRKINFHSVKEIYLQSLSHTIEYPQSLELEELKTNLNDETINHKTDKKPVLYIYKFILWKHNNKKLVEDKELLGKL